MSGYITPEEYGAAINQAREDSTDGFVDPFEVRRRLVQETGREFPSQPPDRPFLTSAEIDDLPAEMREHYRRSRIVRDRADVSYFPKPIRDTFERLFARSDPQFVEILRKREGDEFAEQVAAEREAGRQARAQRAAEIDEERASRPGSA